MTEQRKKSIVAEYRRRLKAAVKTRELRKNIIADLLGREQITRMTLYRWLKRFPVTD